MSSYEVAGLCGTTWLISAVHKNIAAFQRDQFHIGIVDERAKGKMGDDTAHIFLCPGHVPRLPGFAENWECAKVIEEAFKEDTCCSKVHQLCCRRYGGWYQCMKPFFFVHLNVK